MTVSVWNLARGRSLRLDRPVIVGILNITPDSFSDGGELVTAAAALERAELAARSGAAMLDIGGESTRPGATRIDPEEQIARVVPVIAAIRARLPDLPISVDTTLAAVADAAIEAGADAVNDVSAGTEDPQLLPLVATRGAGIILMHRLRPPCEDSFSDQYTREPTYDHPDGVTGAVRDFLASRTAAAVQLGINPASIVIDPGLGFGKTVEQNLTLIRETPTLAALGLPVMSALSRKSFTARAAGLESASPRERVYASIGLSVQHLLRGASLFRVHDVREHRDALFAAAATSVQSEPYRTSAE